MGAERLEEHVQTNGGIPMTPASPMHRFQPGSVMARSQLLSTPIAERPMSPQMLYPQLHQPPQGPKSFVAELPGSMYYTGHLSPPVDHTSRPDNRMSMVSELSSQEATQKGSPNPQTNSDRMSTISDMTNQYRYSTQFGHGGSQSETSGPSDRYSMLSELPSSQQQQLQNIRSNSPPRQ